MILSLVVWRFMSHDSCSIVMLAVYASRLGRIVARRLLNGLTYPVRFIYEDYMRIKFKLFLEKAAIEKFCRWLWPWVCFATPEVPSEMLRCWCPRLLWSLEPVQPVMAFTADSATALLWAYVGITQSSARCKCLKFGNSNYENFRLN